MIEETKSEHSDEVSIQSKNEFRMDDMISFDSTKQPIQESPENSPSSSHKSEKSGKESQDNVFEYIPEPTPPKVEPKP